METLPNPHDRLFKEIWSNIEVVKDFLRYYVPKDVSALLDPEQMEICKDSFVGDELKEYYSDILYRVMLNIGEDGYLYFLFEHKSYPDKYVPLQILGYEIGIWRLHLKQEKYRTKKHLPFIIPVVIYHGREKWREETDLSHLFGDVPDPLAAYIPDFRFDLYDLSVYSDDQIKGNVLLRVLFLLFKYVYHSDFQKKLPQIFSLFRELLEKETGMQYLETVMRYVLAASEITLDELRISVESSLSEKGETLMSTAEKIFNEGIQQGIQRGIQQGVIEAIELGLGIKFGAYGLKLMPAILKITDFGKLRAIKEAIKIAGNLSEVEAVI